MRLIELQILTEAIASFEDWKQREQSKQPDEHVDWSSLEDWFKHKLNSNLNALQAIDLTNAKAKSDRWHQQFYSKKKEIEGKYQKTDPNVVFTYKNFIVYQLKSAAECKLEGEVMQNCASTYGEYVEDDRTQLYSIRSKHDHHVLIEVTDDFVKQIKGKQNKTPEKKEYLEAAFAFIDAMGLAYGYEAKQVKNLFDMMNGKTEFRGDLDLRFTDITELPDRLRVGGDLELIYSKITKLPDGLEVEGSLNMYDTKISQLPVGLKVGGGLDLRYTPITELPDDLEVGGYLNLRFTYINQLPDGLKVGGEIYR